MDTLVARACASSTFVPVPKAPGVRPRDLVSPWPGGNLKRGADLLWGERALDQALIVQKIERRIERNGAKLEHIAAMTGISTSTLNRFLTGQSWPTFYVVTTLARRLYYPELWEELATYTQEGLS